MTLLISTAAYGAEIPLCLYGVDNPADLPTVKKAGFSCFQTYNQEPQLLAALAKQAQKTGLKAVFSPYKLLGTPYEKQVQHWPILAWYLVDEPDVQRWSRARVLEAYNKTKAAFPFHDGALVIGQGKTAVPYYDLPDILMMDWYPVPHLPLESFGQQVALAKYGQHRMGAGQNPLWGVVQSFDWKEFEQYRPDDDRIGRFPTADEIRFMSYHGLVNGADGLFYFIFTSNGVPLPKAKPADWARVAKATQELARFSRVIRKAAAADNPLAVAAPLQMRSWQDGKWRYSVLVNASAEPQPAPAALLTKAYKTLLGTRKQAVLPPYSVWILKSKVN